MKNHREGRNPALFFILTFLFSWGIWLPSIFMGLGMKLPLDAAAYTAVTVPIGAFAPLLAAVTMVVRRHGWKEAWNFIRQAFDFKVKTVYLVLALVIPLVITAAAHYLTPMLGLNVAATLFPEDLPVSPLNISDPIFFVDDADRGWAGRVRLARLCAGTLTKTVGRSSSQPVNRADLGFVAYAPLDHAGRWSLQLFLSRFRADDHQPVGCLQLDLQCQ